MILQRYCGACNSGGRLEYLHSLTEKERGVERKINRTRWISQQKAQDRAIVLWNYCGVKRQKRPRSSGGVPTQMPNPNKHSHADAFHQIVHLISHCKQPIPQPECRYQGQLSRKQKTDPTTYEK